MPKSKEYISESESGSGSDYEPKSKKSKAAKKSPEKPSKPKSKEVSFQLSKMRFASVSEFKGKPLINIREFYEKDGELLPGRKGISLSRDQWNNLKSHVSDIDEALKEF